MYTNIPPNKTLEYLREMIENSNIIHKTKIIEIMEVMIKHNFFQFITKYYAMPMGVIYLLPWRTISINIENQFEYTKYRKDTHTYIVLPKDSFHHSVHNSSLWEYGK